MVNLFTGCKINIKIARHLDLVKFIGAKQNLSYFILYYSLPLRFHTKLGACCAGSAVAVISGKKHISISIQDHNILISIVPDSL